MTDLTSPLETATRQRIDRMLQNLGWQVDESEPACNVTTGRPRTKAEVEALRVLNSNGAYPDYVLYDSSTWQAIAVIEAKRPGSSMPAAIKQSRDYAAALGCAVSFAIDGGVVEAFWVQSGLPIRENGLTVNALLSERHLLRFSVAGTDLSYSEVPTKTREDLIAVFKKANELLRQQGMREGLERFTEFSNLLFLKLVDEIEKDRASNGLEERVAARYRWSAFSKKTADDMLDYINDTVLPKLVGRYNHSGDVFADHLQISDSEILKSIVDELDGLVLLDVDSDVKGDAFEYFLKNSVTVGNDLGEYYTPRHVVRLMIDMVDPKFGETIYDPCCGTGGFLIEAFRHIRRRILPSKENLKVLESRTFYGGELTGTAKLAKMNMILAGDGHANIVQQDSLSRPVRGRYDVIVSNFPFSQRTQHSTLYGLAGQSANPVFLAHIMDALKPGGRAAVVVPDGTLFGMDAATVSIRRRLLTEYTVQAIVQLDPFVFAPYTKQPTSVLVFEKRRSAESVWFFNLVNDGFAKSTKRIPVDADDMMSLRSSWPDRMTGSNSFSIRKDAITSNCYKLFLNAYAARVSAAVHLTLGDLCEEIRIGATPSRSNYQSFRGDIPWAKVSDLDSQCMTETSEYIDQAAASGLGRNRLVPSGTLLMSFKLTIGRTAITGTPMFTNEAIAALVLKSEYRTPEIIRYLYFVLPVIDYRPFAQRATKGLTLNSQSLREVEVPFPDERARKQILAQFDEVEAKRTEYRRKMAELRAQQVGIATRLYE